MRYTKNTYYKLNKSVTKSNRGVQIKKIPISMVVSGLISGRFSEQGTKIEDVIDSFILFKEINPGILRKQIFHFRGQGEFIYILYSAQPTRFGGGEK